MTKFLLYVGEGKAFDQHLAERAIEGIEGVAKCERGDFIGAVFECTYSASSESEAIVRISKDVETVTIDGIEDDAFKFSIEFQKNYPEPIHMVDMDYKFDIDISNYDSEMDLNDAIRGLD